MSEIAKIELDGTIYELPVIVGSENEKAMLQIQLANIAASKGKWKQAQNYYRNIKTKFFIQIQRQPSYK